MGFNFGKRRVVFFFAVAGVHMVRVEKRLTFGDVFFLVLCRHVSHHRRSTLNHLLLVQREVIRAHDAQTNFLSVHRVLGTL